MINSVSIAEHIGRKHELIIFDSGKHKVTFFVGINKVKNGKEAVIWIPVEPWDTQANFVSKFLKSGSFIVVQGRLDYSSWEDEDGNKKARLYVVANRVESPKPKTNKTTDEIPF